LALCLEIISRKAARSVSIKSTAYLIAMTSPSRCDWHGHILTEYFSLTMH
jgi:hypothetical protein